MRHIIRLRWAPDHCGIDGNEKLDGLARQKSAKAYLGPESALGVSTGRSRTILMIEFLLKPLQGNKSQLTILSDVPKF